MIHTKNLRKRLGALSVLALGVLMAGSVSAQTSLQISAAQQQWNARYNAARFWAAANNWPLQVFEGDRVIAQLIAVESGKPVYIGPKDRRGSETVGAHLVWPGGSTGLNLTGGGVIIGIWDDGGTASHPEFGNRVTYGDNSGTGQHATWVASSAAAAGVNSNARGVAYQASIRSYNWNNNLAEILASVNNGVRISNHSYGLSQGWVFGARGDGKWVWLGNPAISATQDWQLGSYGQAARDWDQTQFNAPSQIIVLPSGNERLEGPASQPVEHWVFENGAWALNTTATRDRNGAPNGYDSLTNDFTAKNPIVVSAIQKIPGGYTGPNSVVMSSFANWGPTDDGRIKPDLTAPGVAMFEADAGGGYASVDGTSFAAPSVAGGLALLMQQYQTTFSSNPRAATLKALAIHTADEAGANEGPDYQHGWGLMNVARGAQTIAIAGFNANTIVEQRLNSGQTRNTTYQIGGGGEFRATIAWMDPASNVQAASLNPRNPILVNDLDLRVIHVQTNTTYFPFKLDPANPANAATRGDNNVDNVEQVVIPNAPSGTYIVRVTHKGSQLRPSGGQDYSGVVTGPLAGGLQEMTINPTTAIGGLQSAFATVVLSETRNEPTTLQLSSSNSTAVQIPSSITIPANEASTTFLINTRSVQTTQNVRIFAGSSLGAVNAELTVTPVTLGNNFTLSVSEIVGGNTLNGTVTLNSPAPSGGATVYFSSSLPGTARANRNWIRIPAGMTQGSVGIITNGVVEPRNVRLTASRGSVQSNADLLIKRASVASITSPNNTVAGGSTFNATITLDGPAPSGGAAVQLSSSNTAIATVPASVVVPAGQRTRTVQVRTFRPGTPTSVTISATRFGVTRQRTVTVNP